VTTPTLAPVAQKRCILRSEGIIPERLIISTVDGVRITDVLARSARSSSVHVRLELASKLRQAELCEPARIPPKVITMNSRALLLTDRWFVPRECHLVYPDDANCLEDRISVMSPLGMRLLGCHEGSRFDVWNGKRLLRVCIVGVTYQPEAEKHWHR